ncbi:chemotaxis protein CheY [Alcanivorax sp. 97CO-5]|jgi:CheY-like chemotaxis protein/signal transduction histidine kinase/HAMP domain-containing protein|uniref:response regulator n=1 Tax=unclassified Alcanivorax TaxID=2638842 RepID=UPI0003E7D9E2|nr:MULTISPECIES: response regulator [unclassified Alcanivorax]EUC71256.1 chemotaxis protein CheY [Alcanivorax sp. 97CO-5]PKG02686.1 two-component system sensor histidine kinase/response regulator [Alcanivorax sp. 97CO-6]
MNWFQNLSVRLKILSVAGLGVVLFIVYAAYSFYIAETNIDHLKRIESQDFPILELINANNVDFITISESYIESITEADPDLLEQAQSRAAAFEQRLVDIRQADPTLSNDVEELRRHFTTYINGAAALARNLITTNDTPDHLSQRISHVRALQDAYESSQKAFEQERYKAFRETLNRSRSDNLGTQKIGLFLGFVAFTLLALTALWVTRAITLPLKGAVDAADNIANGKWDTHIENGGQDETGYLLQAIRKMRDALIARHTEDRQQETVKNHLAELNNRMRGEMGFEQLGNNILSFLVPVLDAQVGAFYSYDADTETLSLSSSYAMERRKHLANKFRLGESLVGQCALERKSILLEKVPDSYISIASGTGAGQPRNVVVMPVIHEDEVKGVLEIGAFRDFNDGDLAFMEQCASMISVSLHSAQSRFRLANMLEQTQSQAEALEQQKTEMAQVNADLEEQAMELSASESRLQQQQEELKAINEELESQTQALRASEESLQNQQEELRVTNEELEAQARMLTEQKSEMAQKNDELELLRHELEDKIRELEMSSRYKSEFLSTMSHELRTPLNSILILSNALAQNKKGYLEEKQVEHAQVIHSAGTDLLSLINDILDISKIEEGKMDVIIDDLSPTEIVEHFRRNFAHVAESRNLDFKVELGDTLPDHFYTDRQRLEQIIKNLLSNALKFTEHGSVMLSLTQPDVSETLPSRHLVPGQTLKFAVTDTGTGIAREKQKLIFEAFQQADGTTSRKYGGTGLGLTISRELARLLGGEIGLYSDGEGQGSTFALYLPVGRADEVETNIGDGAGEDINNNGQAHTAPMMPLNPDSDDFVVREKTVLIVEDDDEFARVLVELASDYGLEGHVCHDGEDGLEYASHYRPSAIILDIGLPGIDGWEVMEKLKADPRTKDIPVHFLSGRDERNKALEMGALDFMSKPANEDDILCAFAKIEGAIETNVRRLLVVEDSQIQHESIRELFNQKGVEITAATNGQQALDALKSTVFDCMILDLTLPDMSGFELLETLHANDDYGRVPVVVYTGKDMSREEEAKLRKYADRIILKTERSHERLLNEASLFLHWLESTLPANRRPKVKSIEHRGDIFEGKQLLLVDDDMRNIYALSAQLEELGFSIHIANNGREALQVLDDNPSIDIVLMDIMMPEMDGYEAMARIREQSQFSKLPILALTAKAMKNDRAKCIEAGANDYCSKPIDMAKLTSLLRVWLHT